MPPFLLSSRFDSRETLQAPYDSIQAIVCNNIAHFSVYRLLQNWPERMSKAPPSQKRWYVMAKGNPPPESLFIQVTEANNMGEPLPIPGEVTDMLIDKRMKEIAERPYTEIHRSFTLLDPQKRPEQREDVCKTKRKAL